MDAKQALREVLDEAAEFDWIGEYAAIQNLADKLGVFVDMWSRNDIAGQIEEADYAATDDRIAEVMDEMGRRMDASIGINWSFIDACISNLSDEWGDPDLLDDDEEDDAT